MVISLARDISLTVENTHCTSLPLCPASFHRFEPWEFIRKLILTMVAIFAATDSNLQIVYALIVCTLCLLFQVSGNMCLLSSFVCVQFLHF